MKILGLIVVLLAGCATVDRAKYDTDVAGLKKQVKELESGNAQLFSERGTCQQQLSTCQTDLANTRSKGDATLASALKRIQELENISAAQRAIFDKLRGQLDSLVKAGKLSVSIVRGQFTVQMSDKILFDSGRYELKDTAEETLIELTGILAGLEGRNWQVSGHTDSDGDDDFNWKLSGNRSRVVLAFMIEHAMPPNHVSFAGYGKNAPTATNDTPENKSLNRRIEIVLIPDLEALLGPLTQPPN